ALLVRSPLGLLPLALTVEAAVSGRRGSWRARLTAAAPLWAGFLLLLPWVYLNKRVFGEWVLLERGRAAANAVMGALGSVSTAEEQHVYALTGVSLERAGLG